jgi:pyruvate,water dikinase
LTTPAWTVLFERAAAVVTDVGSVAAHASVIAREYGIPAVVGVQGATTRITTGQRLRVDGTIGRVVVLD